jgi:tetratricopeptide (TPR) repeat protein
MVKKSVGRWVLVCLVGALCLASTARASAQSASQDDPDRQRAFELWDAGKLVDAMPLLENLTVKYPSDLLIKERWAFSIAAYARTIQDPQQRVKARQRARHIALETQQAGSKSPLLLTLLEQIPEDGSEAAFSDKKEVDEMMKGAEADFAQGNYDKAREQYLRALLLEPNNYEAALFIGDVYFKQRVFGSAGEWFGNAVKINPDRETAYRYWGDALAMAGKPGEARAKYIEAIIAEPYVRLSWQGLTQWAQINNVKLNYIRLQDRSSVTAKDDKNINITLDYGAGKNDPNSLAWTTYALGRAAWHGEKFHKEFPSEPAYRHTMKEEADSLQLMITVLKEQKDFNKLQKKLDPSLAELIRIDQAGLMEPFVLLNRADADVAKDYVAYRKVNRDKIRQYLDDIVVPPVPSSAPAK